MLRRQEGTMTDVKKHPIVSREEWSFYEDGSGTVFHTYSTYARGIDLLNSAYNILDLVAKGRDEEELEFTQDWVRHHDKYQD
jgi:predicted dithiol-disulfide oxidoreductase (DUF899 family)